MGEPSRAGGETLANERRPAILSRTPDLGGSFLQLFWGLGRNHDRQVMFAEDLSARGDIVRGLVKLLTQRFGGILGGTHLACRTLDALFDLVVAGGCEAVGDDDVVGQFQRIEHPRPSAGWIGFHAEDRPETLPGAGVDLHPLPGECHL